MRGATERVQRETARTAVEERRRLDRASKAKQSKANVRSGENVPAAQQTVTPEAAATRSGHKGLVVVIEDSVAPASEAAAGGTPPGVRSVQV